MLSQVRKDFPYLDRRLKGRPIVYFDSAATTQKPRQVLEAMFEAAAHHYGNVHRGIHTLSQEATESYEGARVKLAQYIGAKDWREVVFTKNATEAINLVVWSFAAHNLKKGDTVLLTEMEHHSNLVPWLMLRDRLGIKIEYVKITEDGRLDLNSLKLKVQSLRPKIFSFTHASNVLGTINPVGEIVKLVRKLSPNTVIVVDGAQAAPHLPVNVARLGVDFYAISAHKMLGPTGIGCLYGRRGSLEKLKPVFGGGDMIRSVSFKSVTFTELPWRLEPGTPAITEAIGWGEAIDYLKSIGMEKIAKHEEDLNVRFLDQFNELKSLKAQELKLYGPNSTKDRTATFSFNLSGLHAHDLASLLDERGIAIRSGHHCAQPLLARLGTKAAARASFYLYNTEAEIDYFFKSLAMIRDKIRV
ncbi:SufS family cysteine desulfurase [Candidatus Berkelbacteria bacterium]|nr:SufS family cysteine desulfurase [Candidatus Berkelbacteria bacterium]